MMLSMAGETVLYMVLLQFVFPLQSLHKKRGQTESVCPRFLCIFR